MKISEIIRITDSKIRCGSQWLDRDIREAFSSDLLSDVLTINKPGIVLLTGAANLQTIRTAEIAEVACILLVRGKKATEEMVKLAEENNLVIIENKKSMFGVSGLLYQSGIKPIY